MSWLETHAAAVSAMTSSDGVGALVQPGSRHEMFSKSKSPPQAPPMLAT
jgi:hypothetical protein